MSILAEVETSANSERSVTFLWLTVLQWKVAL